MYGDFFVTIELDGNRIERLPHLFESLYNAGWSLFKPESERIACYANRVDADPEVEVSSVEELMHFSKQNATFSILLWNDDGTDLTLKVSCVKNITRFIFYWSQWGVYSDKLTVKSLEAEFLVCCLDDEARGFIFGKSNQCFWDYEDIEAWLSSAKFARTSPKPSLVILNYKYISDSHIASLKKLRTSGSLHTWGFETKWNKPMDQSEDSADS
jgi:hypothetical protein